MDEVDRERRRVEAEEHELVFDGFSNDDALALGLAIVDKARERRLSIAVDVERSGQRLFHFAAEGTSPDNDAWIERKKALVRRVFRSSYSVGLELRAKEKTIEEGMDLRAAEFAAHGGCFPIVVKGVGFVGTVTVSGLLQKDDHDLVVESIREFLAARKDG